MEIKGKFFLISFVVVMVVIVLLRLWLVKNRGCFFFSINFWYLLNNGFYIFLRDLVKLLWNLLNSIFFFFILMLLS